MGPVNIFFSEIYSFVLKKPELRRLAMVNRSEPGARFSKVPMINGAVQLLLFTCKVEVSVVLHLTLNYQLMEQNGVVC